MNQENPPDPTTVKPKHRTRAEVFRAIIFDHRISHGAFRLWHFLQSHLNYRRGDSMVWPGYSAMHREGGFRIQSIAGFLAELESAGWIRISRGYEFGRLDPGSKGGGRRPKSKYEILDGFGNPLALSQVPPTGTSASGIEHWRKRKRTTYETASEALAKPPVELISPSGRTKELKREVAADGSGLAPEPCGTSRNKIRWDGPGGGVGVIAGAVCRFCGTPLSTGVLWCGADCARAFHVQTQKSKADSWVQEWIPSLYQSTTIDRLPDQEATRLMLEFIASDGSGLYAYGPTGTGKTRSLVTLCRRLIEENGDAVIYTRGKPLGDEIVERTRPGGSGSFAQWMRQLKSVDVLAIDELDKISFSDRVVAEVFELIEVRTSTTYPTLYVAQCDLETLRLKISGHRGRFKEEASGIVRRIRENCLPILFENPENPL